MKSILCTLTMVFLSVLTMHAQRGSDARGAGRRAERVQAIKVGYLTDRLQLTPQQATTFWPMYNDYTEDIRSARKAHRQSAGNGLGDGASDRESLEYIDDNIEFQEQKIAITKRYKERFLKVISAQQLVSLYDAERDFKKLLLQQLRQRRGGGGRRN